MGINRVLMLGCWDEKKGPAPELLGASYGHSTWSMNGHIVPRRVRAFDITEVTHDQPKKKPRLRYRG
jgi:hypothetical protein